MNRDYFYSMLTLLMVNFLPQMAAMEPIKKVHFAPLESDNEAELASAEISEKRTKKLTKVQQQLCNWREEYLAHEIQTYTIAKPNTVEKSLHGDAKAIRNIFTVSQELYTKKLSIQLLLHNIHFIWNEEQIAQALKEQGDLRKLAYNNALSIGIDVLEDIAQALMQNKRELDSWFWYKNAYCQYKEAKHADLKNFTHHLISYFRYYPACLAVYENELSPAFSLFVKGKEEPACFDTSNDILQTVFVKDVPKAQMYQKKVAELEGKFNETLNMHYLDELLKSHIEFASKLYEPAFKDLQSFLFPTNEPLYLLPDTRKKILSQLKAFHFYVKDTSDIKTTLELRNYGLALYDKGDLKNALAVLEKAALDNDPIALQFLCVLYTTGDQVEKNIERAMCYMLQLFKTDWFKNLQLSRKQYILKYIAKPVEMQYLQGKYRILASDIENAESFTWIALNKRLAECEREALQSNNPANQDYLFDSKILDAILHCKIRKEQINLFATLLDSVLQRLIIRMQSGSLTQEYLQKCTKIIDASNLIFTSYLSECVKENKIFMDAQISHALFLPTINMLDEVIAAFKKDMQLPRSHKNSFQVLFGLVAILNKDSANIAHGHLHLSQAIAADCYLAKKVQDLILKLNHIQIRKSCGELFSASDKEYLAETSDILCRMFSVSFYHKAQDPKKSLEELADVIIQAVSTLPAKFYLLLVQRCQLDGHFKLWRKQYKGTKELTFRQQSHLVTESLLYLNHLTFLASASPVFKPIYMKHFQKQLLRQRELTLKALQYASKNPILPDEWEGFCNLLNGYKSQLETCEMPQAKLDKAIFEKARATFKPKFLSK